MFGISYSSNYHSMTSVDTITALTELRDRHVRRLHPVRMMLASKLGIRDLPWPAVGMQ